MTRLTPVSHACNPDCKRILGLYCTASPHGDYSSKCLNCKWASPSNNKPLGFSDSKISDYNLWHVQLATTSSSFTNSKKVGH